MTLASLLILSHHPYAGVTPFGEDGGPMQYEAPEIEDLGSISDHTFTHGGVRALQNFPLNLFAGLGLGSAPS